jgi:hypothetical protein
MVKKDMINQNKKEYANRKDDFLLRKDTFSFRI